MHSLKLALVLGSLLLLTACENGVSADPAIDGIRFSYKAATSKAGDCQPERDDLAFIGDSGLFAVRGESVYAMPAGKTEIPFQAVYKNPDENGLADDRAITMLNYPGTCGELEIEITIDYCEYYGDSGIERRACPEIVVEGVEPFANFQLVRKDDAEN